MEYFVGAAITLGVVFAVNKYLKSTVPVQSIPAIKYSQSHIYELMKPYIPMMPPPDLGKRQSVNFLKNRYMRIMVVKNKAYWIKDNAVFVANVVDGNIDKEDAKEIDTMAMSKVELDEMLFIVEQLREEDNDSRGTGKS